MAIVGTYRSRIVSGRRPRALAAGYNGFGDLTSDLERTREVLGAIEEGLDTARTAWDLGVSMYGDLNPDSRIGNDPAPSTPARTPISIDSRVLDLYSRNRGRLRVVTPPPSSTGTGTGTGTAGDWLAAEVNLPGVGLVPRWQAGLGIAAVATGIGLIVKSFL